MLVLSWSRNSVAEHFLITWISTSFINNFIIALPLQILAPGSGHYCIHLQTYCSNLSGLDQAVQNILSMIFYFNLISFENDLLRTNWDHNVLLISQYTGCTEEKEESLKIFAGLENIYFVFASSSQPVCSSTSTLLRGWWRRKRSHWLHLQ